MKKSKYNCLINLENEDILLYNTLSRKYILIDKSEEQKYMKLYDKVKIQNQYFDKEEADIICKMFQKGILIKDDLNEIDVIEFNENKIRFGDQYYYLVLQPTLACNFRCTYCYEEHREDCLDDILSERILKYIDNISKRVKHLRIGWFGGEPLLELNRIITFTREAKEICKRNNCHYSATITTNGYLLNEETISCLEELSIGSVQVTVDGYKKYHDEKRMLENGEGTYDIISENLKKLSYKNIKINLRVNADEENYNNIIEIYNIIPKENRRKCSINMSNLFKNNGKLDFYDLYLNAINKGYAFYNTTNSFMTCEVCVKNGITIEPTCEVVPCSMASEKGYTFGKIDEHGNLIMENKNFFYGLKNTTALKSKKCAECIMLPMCMGKCKLSRYLNPDICNMRIPDGLSLEEIIKLHYYSDITKIV